MKQKIYLVVARSWNEKEVVGVFLSKEAVEAALPKICEDNKTTVEVEEWEDGETR